MFAVSVLTHDTAWNGSVLAAAAHLLYLPPQLRHPQPQQPLIYFYLLFSHAARLSAGLPLHCATHYRQSAPQLCGCVFVFHSLDTAPETAAAVAAGARTVRPHARQPGQLVVQLRQVHLAHTAHRAIVHDLRCKHPAGTARLSRAEQACTCS